MNMESIAFTAPVAALLEKAGLPTDDLAAGAPVKLLGIANERACAGVVGLELFGGDGLLRSLAVEPARQKTGLGRALVDAAEQEARKAGVRKLYLLTTTAEPYFAKLGYRRVPRADAPASITATAQFASLCPSSAAFMCKTLA